MLITGPSEDPDERVRRERTEQYWERVQHHARVERKDRLEVLRARENTLHEAVRIYAIRDVGQVPQIGIRRGFITLLGRSAITLGDDLATSGPEKALLADIRTETDRLTPPLARLIYRQSRSLSFYLTMIYTFHLEFQGGARAFNQHGVNGRRADTRPDSWTQLAAMTENGTVRARRARGVRALDELERAGLVALASDSTKYEKFDPLKEDGSGQHYLVPGQEADDTVRLDTAFFFHGWHLVLTPKEIATYLVFREASARLRAAVRLRGQAGVALARSERVRRYGLSDEAYQSIHTLHEFGLIEIIDPMPHRRNGRFDRAKIEVGEREGESFFPVPFQIKMLRPPTQNAYDVITNTLRSKPWAPRFDWPYRAT